MLERGMRLLVGDEAADMRRMCNDLSVWTRNIMGPNSHEVQLPTIEPESMYQGRLGYDLSHMMFTVRHPNRSLVLRPEGTATVVAWARHNWKSIANDTVLFYTCRCFRRDKPQRGRYREFTQFGVELLKPAERELARSHMHSLSVALVSRVLNKSDYNIKRGVIRNADYYTSDGWEIECPALGAQKQVCGGGEYEEGVGFAIGVDRLLLARQQGIEYKGIGDDAD